MKNSFTFYRKAVVVIFMLAICLSIILASKEINVFADEERTILVTDGQTSYIREDITLFIGENYLEASTLALSRFNYCTSDLRGGITTNLPSQLSAVVGIINELMDYDMPRKLGGGAAVIGYNRTTNIDYALRSLSALEMSKEDALARSNMFLNNGAQHWSVPVVVSESNSYSQYASPLTIPETSRSLFTEWFTEQTGTEDQPYWWKEVMTLCVWDFAVFPTSIAMMGIEQIGNLMREYQRFIVLYASNDPKAGNPITDLGIENTSYDSKYDSTWTKVEWFNGDEYANLNCTLETNTPVYIYIQQNTTPSTFGTYICELAIGYTSMSVASFQNELRNPRWAMFALSWQGFYTFESDLCGGNGEYVVYVGYNTTNNPNKAIRGVVLKTQQGRQLSFPNSTLYIINNMTYIAAEVYRFKDNDIVTSYGYSDNSTFDDDYNAALLYTFDPAAGDPLTDDFLLYGGSYSDEDWITVKNQDGNLANTRNSEHGSSYLAIKKGCRHVNESGTIFNNDYYCWENCDKCGRYFNKQVHTFEVSEVIKQPTCLENGMERVKCTHCGYTCKREVLALGHNWKHVSGGASGHTTNCTRCKESHFNEHNFLHSDVMKHSCTEKGSYIDVCTDCFYFDGIHLYEEYGEHDHSKSEVVSEPSYGYCGITNHICKYCGHIEEERTWIYLDGLKMFGPNTWDTCVDNAVENSGASFNFTPILYNLNRDCRAGYTILMGYRTNSRPCITNIFVSLVNHGEQYIDENGYIYRSVELMEEDWYGEGKVTYLVGDANKGVGGVDMFIYCTYNRNAGAPITAVHFGNYYDFDRDGYEIVLTEDGDYAELNKGTGLPDVFMFVQRGDVIQSKAREYSIRIQTADCWWAGTDSEISVAIHCKNGNTSWRVLDISGNDDFERDDCDTYSFWSQDYGEIEGIELHNAGSDAWCVAWVELDGTTYHLHGAWLEESYYYIDATHAEHYASIFADGSYVAILLFTTTSVAVCVYIVVVKKKKSRLTV
ncbi:MAG: PLAT/LH2 domain-containing protein [Clostridia bacterium]|nr:PLAT/LH2 domain-containing protein [Clostridia bacterium]